MNSANAIYDVLLPVPLPGSFDYFGDPGVIAPNGLVEVPFGKRQLTGLVLAEKTGTTLAHDKIKSIIEPAPLPALDKSFTQFLLWSAHYNMTPPGMMLKMALMGTKLPKLPKNAPETAPPVAHHHTPQLTSQQQDAAAILRTSFAEKQPQPVLLDGVTGSGKTEVYCEAIAACLGAGKQALVLMPEIALTTAMLERFAARFGAQPTVWHSDLKDRQRRINWWAIAKGGAKLIVGARSALFLPYASLGLIVVDEEHEAAYKQEEGVIYHARDMAVARAHHAKIPVILASATPSLESHVNAESGRYRRVVLPDRFGGATMPAIRLIDMRTENLPKTKWLSAPLLDALHQTLAAGEQAMLFLNRRGYAPLTLCRTCGHRLQCPQCSAWFVTHMRTSKLQCHHCGYTTPQPPACPACQTKDHFASCGPGVERIAEEVKTLLPHARSAIMSSDILDSPQAIAGILDQVHGRKLDILIGTQIMAKGYHFPEMTLVGVVDADLGLSGGDPRAAERCYQLLQQVSGRSGRAAKAGRVFLQTYQPQHPVMQALASGRRAEFIAAELNERQTYALPPFRRLAAIILSGANAAEVDQTAAFIVRSAPQDEKLRLLGPAPAPLAMLRGKHRRRLLLIAAKELNLQALLHGWLGAIKIPSAVKLQIDIDPYSFY
ncbi:MAG: primosomal protein N' [Alphaproteobacteria bacterium]